MPDQDGHEHEKPQDLYRCTFWYADHVPPPAIPGEVALQECLPDQSSAHQRMEEGAARTDLGRMAMERRISEDGDKVEWGVMYNWVVIGGQWRLR